MTRPGPWTGFKALVTAIHAFPVLLVMTTTLMLSTLAHHGLPSAPVLARVLGVILGSQVAVGALNDYVDRDRDAETQPWKPIPSGQIAPTAVLVLSGVGLLTCAALAATFGPLALSIALVGGGGGLAYDVWLKPTPASVLGYIVGFLSLVAWIWLVVGHLRLDDLLVLPAGALLLLAAHLANALPDVPTDQALGQRGLAVVLGTQRSRGVILGSCTLSALMCLTLTVLRARYDSMLPLTLGTGLTFLAARLSPASADFVRHDAERLFRCAAPAVGLLAVACLLAVEPAL